MRPFPLVAIIVVASALAPAAPAAAHRQWLLPSATTLADTDGWVTIDAAISNDLFYPDHFPLRLDQVKAWTPDGRAAPLENPSTGRYRSTFDVRIDRPGTWRIGTEQAGVMGSFRMNGQEWRVGGRRGTGAPGMNRPARATPVPAGGPDAAARPSVATVAEIPAGATDVKLTETSGRNYVFVTAGAPTAGAFALTGRGLEMQPLTHPDSLVADEEGRFRFLIDGKPAAGVAVTVVPGGKRFRTAEDAQQLTTGPDGLLRVTWPVAGIYWISAVATDNRPTAPRATERRMTYAMTVEVPAP